MAEEVGIAPTTGRTCSRFQGGVLVCAGLLPKLAEGAKFALPMVEVRQDLPGKLLVYPDSLQTDRIGTRAR